MSYVFDGSRGSGNGEAGSWPWRRDETERPRFERMAGTRSSELVIIPTVVLGEGRCCWEGGVCEFELGDVVDGGAVDGRRCWRRW